MAENPKEEYVAGIKLDPDNSIFFNAAKIVLETDRQLIYLTGKAGTGKTTFLKYIVSQYKENKIVLAPTGLAAVNAEGQTIHSFFKLDFSPHLPDDAKFSKAHIYDWLKYNQAKKDLIKSLNLIIIDEISMVRCDILDSIDKILQVFRDSNKPFGGVRMLFIGDTFQLPPIAQSNEWNLLKSVYLSPYFFNAKVYEQSSPFYIQLEKPYRQTELEFLSLLDKIRINEISNEELAKLNSRVVPTHGLKMEKASILLSPRNYNVDKYNDENFSRLNAEEYTFHATITGDYPPSLYPTAQELKLKIGAQVMITKNKWDKYRGTFVYYNGNIGTIREIKDDAIKIELNDQTTVEVEKAEWENIEYRLVQNGKEKTIESIIKGTFSQFPLKLAWAVSIHKSQGMTFDSIYADLAECFSYGQVYVALSRCRKLNGLHLLSPIRRDSIKTDQRILEFAKTETPETLLIQEIEKNKADKLYKQSRAELMEGNILQALNTFNEAIKVRDDRDTPAFQKYCKIFIHTFKHYKQLAANLHKEKQGLHTELAETTTEWEKDKNELNETRIKLTQTQEELQSTIALREQEQKETSLQIATLNEKMEAIKLTHEHQMKLNEQTINLKDQTINLLNQKIEEQTNFIKKEEQMIEQNLKQINNLEAENRQLKTEIERLRNITWWQKLWGKK